MIPICAASKTLSGTSLNRKKKIDQRALSADISDQQFRLLPYAVIVTRGTLEHLLADGNRLNENSLQIPSFPKLKTLTLNHNKIRDVGSLLVSLSRSCPNLKHLSLSGNPGWPLIHDVSRYRKFRSLVLKMMPNLQNLDGVPIKWRDSSSFSLDSSTSDSSNIPESFCLSE